MRTSVAVLAMYVSCGLGCDATRVDHRTCYEGQASCLDGYLCNPSTHRCELARDGGAGAVTEGGADAPLCEDGAASGDGVVGDRPLDEGDVVDGAPSFLDGGNDAGSVVDAAVDAGIDARPTDTAETCGSDTDCVSPGARSCVAGRCVACRSSGECAGASPVCSQEHVCVSCAVVDGGCPSSTPACEADSGRCLECLVDSECSGKPTRSFCVKRACAACSAANAVACGTRDPSKPICLANGSCGECASSADCTIAGKPICDTAAGACSACTSDSQCQAKGTGPGVCLADGHCATAAETAYVGHTTMGSCSDTAAKAGALQSPFCSADKAVASGKPVLIVLGDLADSFALGALAAPLAIIGRGAVITARTDADGVSMVSGDLTLRGLTITGNPLSTRGMGIVVQASAARSATLHVDGCTVTKHADGGILVSGAAFDLRSSTIANNGTGQTSDGIVWSGMRIDKLPTNGSTSLNLITIVDNASTGLSCVAGVHGQGVLARGNAINITTSCGFSSCIVAGPTCGAQP